MQSSSGRLPIFWYYAQIFRLTPSSAWNYLLFWHSCFIYLNRFNFVLYLYCSGEYISQIMIMSRASKGVSFHRSFMHHYFANHQNKNSCDVHVLFQYHKHAIEHFTPISCGYQNFLQKEWRKAQLTKRLLSMAPECRQPHSYDHPLHLIISQM